MKYRIQTATHVEHYDLQSDFKLGMLKMKTANLADVRGETVQLIDENGKVLQTSFPMLVTNYDLDEIAKGYKNLLTAD